jgi:hypothetical protein
MYSNLELKVTFGGHRVALHYIDLDGPTGNPYLVVKKIIRKCVSKLRV